MTGFQEYSAIWAVGYAIPPAITPTPRFLSLVFPPGGTKYACGSKVVTPSKVVPNCVPTSSCRETNG